MGKQQSPAQQARNRLGGTARHNPDGTEDARRDLAEATLAARIREIVDRAPPLTPDQCERLARLLAPGGSA
jgi:hypothetical protein